VSGTAPVRSLVGWAFAAPALFVIAMFFVLPVAAGLLLSLTDFDIYALADLRNLRFVALDNYRALLVSADFWRALGNTFYFVAVGVPLSIGLALAVALLLNAPTLRPAWRAFLRAAVFAPVVTSLVAVAVVWRYLFQVRYGLVNHALGAFGIAPIDWLGDRHWAMPAIILLALWKNYGFNVVLFLAALNLIPSDLYDAAKLDGANAWQRLCALTLPLLRPTLMLVGILTTAGYFQLFAEPYVMTQGGPDRSTVSVLYLMYEQGFRWWNLGTASAIAVLLFALIFVATTAMARAARRSPLQG
jgi:multiple sugar transport system permease protein